MEAYIHGIVGKHKDDPRIVMWDVMNEPQSTQQWNDLENGGRQTIAEFVRWAIQRARQEAPVQPLTVGAYDHVFTLDLVDVVSIHPYALDGFEQRIMEAQVWGKVLGKPVIISEFVGRPQQPVELAMPIAAKRKIGWILWELMLGKTEFTQGKQPYQGHISPDGTCYSAQEVAAILFPNGCTGNAEDAAAQAGFKAK